MTLEQAIKHAKDRIPATMVDAIIIHVQALCDADEKTIKKALAKSS